MFHYITRNLRKLWSALPKRGLPGPNAEIQQQFRIPMESIILLAAFCTLPYLFFEYLYGLPLNRDLDRAFPTYLEIISVCLSTATFGLALLHRLAKPSFSYAGLTCFLAIGGLPALVHCARFQNLPLVFHGLGQQPYFCLLNQWILLLGTILLVTFPTRRTLRILFWRSPVLWLLVLQLAANFALTLWPMAKPLSSWLALTLIAAYLLFGFGILPRYFRRNPSGFLAGLILGVIPNIMAQFHLLQSLETGLEIHTQLASSLKLLANFLPFAGMILDMRQALESLVENLSRRQAVAISMQAQLEEHDQIQEDLESRRSQLEVTIAAIGEAVVTADTEGRINFMNPAAELLTGWRIEEVSLSLLNQIIQFHEWDPSSNPELAKTSADTWSATNTGQAWLQAKDMRLIPIEYSASPIFNKVNSLIGTVIVFHDISEQRKVAKELASARDRAVAASHSKTEFLASVSHEIRTPMNAILGMVDLLKETQLTTEQTKYINTFRGATESLLLLINDILDVSVMESGRINLESRPFNLREMIEIQVNLFRVESNKKGLSLTYDIEDKIPGLVLGDPARLGQILFNLVGNAIKFTAAGEISIRVASYEEGVLFSVTDTGIGVSEENQDRIFDLFTQADTSTTREYGGTGLGLAICRNLVKQMNGNIWVTSEESVGSTFHFTAKLLPADTQSEVQDLYEDDSLEHEDDRPLEILLVEDSSDNRILIEFYLVGTPYHLKVALNGKAAVEMYQQSYGCFDLILMDIQMPVMDGYTATMLIRKLERENGWVHCPMLALTASVLEESVYKTFEAGCDDHLKKPIKKGTLLRAIHRHTHEQSLRKSMAQESARDYLKVIHSDMADLVPTYLNNRQIDLAQLKEAFDRADYERIRAIAHRMKGSGASYGFTTVTELGAEMEHYAIVTDHTQLECSIKGFANYLQYIKSLEQQLHE